MSGTNVTAMMGLVLMESVIVESDILLDFAWVLWAVFAALVFLVPRGVVRLLVGVCGFGVVFLDFAQEIKALVVAVQIALTLYLIHDVVENGVSD